MSTRSLQTGSQRAVARAAGVPRGTLWAHLASALDQYAERPALALRDADPELRWTYRDLLEQVELVARGLVQRGLRCGDRLLIWGLNRPQWAATFLACARLGVVAVPLDYRSASDLIERIAARTEPKLLIADAELLQRLEVEVAPTVVMDELFAPSGAAGLPPAPRPGGGPDDLVEILFTSGTTGEPKGVEVTNRNLLANAEAVAQALEIHPHYRLISILPLSHCFEQIGLIAALGGGASITYLHHLRPASILEALKEERATAMLAVPQVLDLFLSGIEREVRRAGKERQWDLLHAVAARLPFGLRRRLFRQLHERFGGQFEFFAVGGAPLDPDLARRWENTGIKVLQGYGLTEATPVVTLTRLEDRAIGTVGWPMPGIELTIAQDGEVLIRGPQLTPGYWRDPKATAAAFVDGWYHSGDLGEIDAQGRLTLRGRKKNMIPLANGLNVYPEDVEAVLRLHPAIKDSVVVGLQRGRADVDVHAVLVTEHPEQADEAIRSANRRLSGHQQIRGYTIWPEEDFPRTLTMKARRPLIEARLKELGVGEVA